MKLKNRIFAAISLALNLGIISVVSVGLYLVFINTDPWYVALKYFTVDSNVLLALSALFMAICNITKLINPVKRYSTFFKEFKFVSTICTTITFLVSATLLSKQSSFKEVMLVDSFLCLHTLAPLLGIISVIFDKDVKNKYKTVFVSFVPLFIYMIPYVIFAVVPALKEKYQGDWYQFLEIEFINNLIPNPIAAISVICVGMFIVALLLGTILYLVNLIGTNSELKNNRVTYTPVGALKERLEREELEANEAKKKAKEEKKAKKVKKEDAPQPIIEPIINELVINESVNEESKEVLESETPKEEVVSEPIKEVKEKTNELEVTKEATIEETKEDATKALETPVTINNEVSVEPEVKEEVKKDEVLSESFQKEEPKIEVKETQPTEEPKKEEKTEEEKPKKIFPFMNRKPKIYNFMKTKKKKEAPQNEALKEAPSTSEEAKQ